MERTNKYELERKNEAIMWNERLIFALDVPNKSLALHWIERLAPRVRFFKLGLEFLMSGSYFDVTEHLLKSNLKVFADVKLYDIPETVKRAVANLSLAGVHFITVHGSNDNILQAAVEKKGNSKIFAVMSLTSQNQLDFEQMGMSIPLEEWLIERSMKAMKFGCDGIVLSGMDLTYVRKVQKLTGCLFITPGIRASGERTDDHKRVLDAETALRRGADYLVVGRPIRDAEEPELVVSSLLDVLERHFEDFVSE